MIGLLVFLISLICNNKCFNTENKYHKKSKFPNYQYSSGPLDIECADMRCYNIFKYWVNN